MIYRIKIEQTNKEIFEREIKSGKNETTQADEAYREILTKYSYGEIPRENARIACLSLQDAFGIEPILWS